MAYGGSATELYSEVLAQVCLAYAMKNGRAMTPPNLNKDTIDDLKSFGLFYRKETNTRRSQNQKITY